MAKSLLVQEEEERKILEIDWFSNFENFESQNNEESLKSI